MVIISHTAPATNIALVSTSFVSAATFVDTGAMSHAALIDLQKQASDDLLVRLDADECLSTFNNLFQTKFRSALIVTHDSKADVLIQSAEGTSLADLLKDLKWDKSSIDYCLADAARESSSSLNVNGPLLVAINLINVLFVASLVIVLVFALTCRSFNPLVTLGDALASFLANPDPSTQDSCLITKSEISKGFWGEREAKYWFTQSSRWYHVPSFTRWTVWVLTWFFPVGLTTAAMTLAAIAGPKNPYASFEQATVVYKTPDGLPRTGLAVVAALPHLLLSVLYLTTNALLTTCYLSHESSQYAIGSPLPLRVSTGQPIGSQTTSLYLTLPRPVSWVLFFLITGMAFLASQGVTLVSINRDQGPPISGVGFTPLPLLLLGALLLVMGFGVLGMSLRKIDPRGAVESGQPAGNPLALRGGSCSAVFSARCHRVPRESAVETSQVRWGVVREGVGMNAGHATFSNRPVGDVLVGRSYA